MNANRFRPALETLDGRDMPSVATPIVIFEYRVPSASPAPAHDDVVVDGRIITAENPSATDSPYNHPDLHLNVWINSAVRPDGNMTLKGSTIGENHTIHKDESITIGANRTESIDRDKLVGIDFRPQ